MCIRDRSTLLNLIAGVLSPDKGEILLGETNIREFSKNITAQNIAVVHQNNTAPDDITVRKLVAMGRTPYMGLFGKITDSDEKAIVKAMADTDIMNYSDRAISSLSGGQMQRVWLAMALAQDTGILLLDEITTFLDIHYQLEMLNLISCLNKEKKITIIMVLHDINLAAQYCDEIVIMKQGQIIAQGSFEDAMTEEVLGEAFDVNCRIITINNKKHCIFNRKGESYV